jgi:hypothetical protein
VTHAHTAGRWGREAFHAAGKSLLTRPQAGEAHDRASALPAPRTPSYSRRYARCSPLLSGGADPSDPPPSGSSCRGTSMQNLRPALLLSGQLYQCWCKRGIRTRYRRFHRPLLYPLSYLAGGWRRVSCGTCSRNSQRTHARRDSRARTADTTSASDLCTTPPIRAASNPPRRISSPKTTRPRSARPTGVSSGVPEGRWDQPSVSMKADLVQNHPMRAPIERAHEPTRLNRWIQNASARR